MYAGYRQIVIKRKLSGGYSGSLLLVIQPVTEDGEILPEVAKIAKSNSIQEEYNAHQHMSQMWPNILPIIDKPAFSNDGLKGGLRYRLLGDVGTSKDERKFKIENLRSHCQQVETKTICETLRQIFDNMSQTLQQAAYPKHLTFLQTYYDFLLPVNLLIRPDQNPFPSVQRIQLDKQNICDRFALSKILPGEYICLKGFIVTELDSEKGTVTLNLPRDEHKQLAFSYRVRLDSVDTKNYSIGQTIPAIDGLILQTRKDLLSDFAQKAVQEDECSVDLSSETIQLLNRDSLQNPLRLLDEVLFDTHSVKTALIHGDLNLENVLLEFYSESNYKVYCIDVATARHDYVMHDFLRLEAEIISRILPPILEKCHLPVAQTIFSFYKQVYQQTVYRQSSCESLHRGLEKPFQMLMFIRENASHYLSSVHKDGPNKWLEYHRGVMIYLLGALKLQSLEKEGKENRQLPKRAAFWAAATMAEFLANPPSKPVFDCRKLKSVITAGGIVLGLVGLIALLSAILPWQKLLTTQPSPTPGWAYTQEFESDSVPTPEPSKMIPREHASNQTVLGQFGCDQGVATQANSFEYTIEDKVPPTDHLYLQITYSKNSPALADMLIYIDDAYCCKFRPTRPILNPPPPTPDSWDVFGTSKPIDLGPIKLGGSHTIKFETKGQKYCTADLDYFTLSLNP